jgi:hypothetical protein
MSEREEKKSNASGDSGYEKQDVNLLKISIFSLSLIGLVVIIIVLLSSYYVFFREETVYQEILKPESTTLRELRAKEDELLNSYSVIDSSEGVYRIPIKRAMELVAEESFKERLNKAEK